MPSIEIRQTIHYEPSPLERMLEKSLEKHNLELGDLTFKGGGLYRELKFKDKSSSIVYQKGNGFTTVVELVRGYSKEGKKSGFGILGEIKIIDTPKLFEFLSNVNNITYEEINFKISHGLEHNLLILALIQEPRYRRFLIEIPLFEKGRKMFVDAFNNYLNLNINKEVFTKSCFKGLPIMSKGSVNSIIRENLPVLNSKRRTKLRDEEYVDMMVSYSVNSTSLMNDF